MPGLHVATSRPVGERCIEWAKAAGYELVPMDECDVFVSVMYDKLVSESFLEGRRAYNFHPGILPEYRGAGAYSWAIINGERETGVTLHAIDGDIDHGPIVEIQRFSITPKDTAHSLFIAAEVVMERMFRHNFPRIAADVVPCTVQDESKSGIYYRKELAEALDLTRYARAFHFPGKPGAYYRNAKGEMIPVEYA